MSTSWVAGTVRAKALARRRVGAVGARLLAGRETLADAVTALARTPYAHDIRVGQTLAEAQHAVGAALLWHLRVLAGWLPREGADVVRVLAGGFEVANVDEHLAGLRGAPKDPPFVLGTLDTAWSRLTDAASAGEVRAVLETSPWGDPGGATPWEIHVGMRMAWADRVSAGVPEAASWARAAAALLLVRETALGGRSLNRQLVQRADYVLGPAFVAAVSGPPSLRRLAADLPSGTRWALDGADRPEDLWRAEAAWWRRVEKDGFGLLRSSGFGPGPVVGALAVLAVDAWRVRAALEAAARGGAGAALEAFDAVA